MSSKRRKTDSSELTLNEEAPLVNILRPHTEGAYIPPARRHLTREQIWDKRSEQFQRLNWERLKKKIQRQVNIVHVSNLPNVVRDLLQENIIRAKGPLARSIIQAQLRSPEYSIVYAALVAIINSRFQRIGELILRRLIIQFKRSFARNDKKTLVSTLKFLAHLINQQVVHEILALELMVLLLESPTLVSVEIAVAFLTECGAMLNELSPRGVNSIFNRLHAILNESNIGRRLQWMIEAVFKVRRGGFKDYPSVIDDEDQTTHMMNLGEDMNPESELNVFRFDPDFEKNEAMYDEIRREIVGGSGEESEETSDDDMDYQPEENQQGEQEKLTVIDNTGQDLTAFRRHVLLTIQSSACFEEAAHKLLNLELVPGQDAELCSTIVDCCAQQRTYENFFGLLAGRFCRLRRGFQATFERIARDTYSTIHRFEITKLRIMAKLIAHLLCTDAVSWNVLDEISLNEDDTTSAGRVYVKYLFQEMSAFMGEQKLMERVHDSTMQNAFEKIFPRDNPKNTRFSINFFTHCGLGYLTVDLRKHLLQQSSIKRDTRTKEFEKSRRRKQGKHGKRPKKQGEERTRILAVERRPAEGTCTDPPKSEHGRRRL